MEESLTMGNLNCVWSPPKAGRTWLRAAFGKLYTIQTGEDDREAMAYSKRIAHFKHRLKTMDPTQHNHLFLIRDPKDLFVSEYFHAVHRGYDSEYYVGTISEYLRSDWYPIERCLNTYEAYAGLYPRCSSYHVVKYEDMHMDFKTELQGIFGFFEVEHTLPELEEVVAWCKFDNLHTLSSQSYFKSGLFNPVDVDTKESYKFRVGKVGGYKDYLSEEDIEYVHRIMIKRSFSYV